MNHIKGSHKEKRRNALLCLDKSCFIFLNVHLTFSLVFFLSIYCASDISFDDIVLDFFNVVYIIIEWACWSSWDSSPCMKHRMFAVSSFHSFDVEDTGDCRGDWLLLGPTWKAEYRFCGSVLPPPFISSRGRVWVYFHSQANSSGHAQGFRLSYIRGEWP